MLQRIVRISIQIFLNYTNCKDLFPSNILTRDNVTNRRAERDLEKNQRDDVPVREGSSKGCTRMDFAPVPNWTLGEYHCECDAQAKWT